MATNTAPKPSNTVIHSMGMFMTHSYAGKHVQIEVDLIKKIFAELGFRKMEGDTSTLVILPLAMDKDDVDFHLSFSAEGGYAQQCHFCVRLEGRQNECLYWFYTLLQTDKGSLIWSWDGCAGQGDSKVIQKHRTYMVPFNSTPLTQFLDLANQYVESGKAEVGIKRLAVLNDKGNRSGTRDQLTLQLK